MWKNRVYIITAIFLSSAVISAAGLNFKNNSNATIRVVLQLTNNKALMKELAPGQEAKVNAFFEGFETLKVLRFKRDHIGMSITDIELNIPWNTAWSDITFGETKITGTVNQAQGKKISLERNYSK